MAQSPLPPNPFAGLTLAQYGKQLRDRSVTAEGTVRALLARIDTLNPKLAAYTHVAHEAALEAARACDAALKAGQDSGPLMGVPVAVKDLYYVDGMPLTAGSRLDVSSIVAQEGPFIRRLKASGCVVLGKTWTSEFALGGINFTHRVPWNPCDELVHRTPGGSSGGSATAMAAGLCAFALGSDTGGSVRMPAALCGVFGHKFSSDAFSLDGVFPLSPTLDSLGTFARSAADATLIWQTLKHSAGIARVSVSGLRLALPGPVFFEELDADVQSAVDAAVAKLRAAGAVVETVDIPEVAVFEDVFGKLVPIELVGILGRDHVAASLDVFDPIVKTRLAGSLDQRAADYIGAKRKQLALKASATERTKRYDAWLTPTAPLLPEPLADYQVLEKALNWNRRALRNTRPGNIFDQCGVSIPLRGPKSGFPVGLQVLCATGQDDRLLSIAAAIEAAIARA